MSVYNDNVCIQCGLVITLSFVFSKSLQRTPYSLPMRARYGFFCDCKLWFMFCFGWCGAVCSIMNVILDSVIVTLDCSTWIFVVETLCDWIRSPLQIRMTDLRHLDTIRSPSVTELRRRCPNSVTVDFWISNVLYNQSFLWNVYFCVCFSREVCIVSYRNVIFDP